MKLHIVSLNETFIQCCTELFEHSKDVIVQKGDIRDVPRDGAAFVSPANSLGHMDGGIDLVFSREMFPGCETLVKSRIREVGETTLVGRPYLRVGSAVWTFVGEHAAQEPHATFGEFTALITTPTMFLPHPIPHTRNVYWAMQAALLAMQKIQDLTQGKIDTLVVTSMGCGVGCMDPEASALQIRAAWREYETSTLPDEVINKGPHVVLLPSHDDAQPSNYDNREIGIAWPPGWAPAAVGPTGLLKQVAITTTTPSWIPQNRAHAVCYDA